MIFLYVNLGLGMYVRITLIFVISLWDGREFQFFWLIGHSAWLGVVQKSEGKRQLDCAARNQLPS